MKAKPARFHTSADNISKNTDAEGHFMLNVTRYPFMQDIQQCIEHNITGLTNNLKTNVIKYIFKK